jgi:hypothetical protein
MLLLLIFQAASAAAQEPQVPSFATQNIIREHRTVYVLEDITVDFATLRQYRLLRDIPVEYKYDAGHSHAVPIQANGCWATDVSRWYADVHAFASGAFSSCKASPLQSPP